MNLKTILESILGVVAPTMITIAPARSTEDTTRSAIVLRDGYALKLPRLVNRRAHQLQSIDSLVAYAHRHGQPGKTTVYVSPTEIAVELLDTPGTAPVDEVVRMSMTPSLPFLRSKELVGRWIGHKDFADSIDLLRDYILEKPFVGGVRELRGSREVSYDAKLDNGTSIGLRMSERVGNGGGQGVTPFPERVTMAIPLFDGVPIIARWGLRVTARMTEKEGVQLRLDDINLADERSDTLEQVLASLQGALPEGFLVVRGVWGIEEAK